MKLIALILTISLMLSLVGCKADPAPQAPDVEAASPAVDLLRLVQKQTVESRPADRDSRLCFNDLAAVLLQNSRTEGENCILSPYSILVALSMAANGAQGRTLAQMQDVLGLSVPELNSYLSAMEQNKGKELLSANSLWLQEDYSIKDSFLQSIADHYDAGLYSAPFTDSTLKEMNQWIREKTAGQIPAALDQIDPNAVLYLINALSFDGKWDSPFSTDRLQEGSFYGTKGEESAEFMGSKENLYIEDALATGFLKDYAGGQYSFLALLPKEGISLSEFLASLNGESLTRLVEEAQQSSVNILLPKLSIESSLDLKEALTAMGMEDAFTRDADFSAIEEKKELYISRILHKTSLTVDEAGTKAGAVTIEEFALKSSPMQQKSVVLNRPFVMGIYDKLNGCFLFLGTVESLG